MKLVATKDDKELKVTKGKEYDVLSIDTIDMSISYAFKNDEGTRSEANDWMDFDFEVIEEDNDNRICYMMDMPQYKEIERKFLVKRMPEKVDEKIDISQGYLFQDDKKIFRVRIANDKAFITIKFNISELLIERFEWENEISMPEGLSLLTLCDRLIEKVRHKVKVGNHTFEIDVFGGNNKGLVLAEIELDNQDEEFEKPDWLGEEVTNDPKYCNSELIKNPFKNW